MTITWTEKLANSSTTCDMTRRLDEGKGNIFIISQPKSANQARHLQTALKNVSQH